MFVLKKVPIVEVGEINYIQAVQISDTQAIVALGDGVEIDDSWGEVAEDEWESVKPQDAPVPPPQPTVADISQNNMDIMMGMADIFEQLLAIQTKLGM